MDTYSKSHDPDPVGGATVSDRPVMDLADDQPAVGGCHGGQELSKAAARSAGNDALMDRLETDYPKGPHDQPQSMCPAFGSLRVGLRMRRTATILSGSACCVYGLTFTSHFYGAKRSVGYVPFNSETLVTGKLFEDIGLPKINPQDDRAMLCGSPAMLKDTCNVLDEFGLTVSPKTGVRGDYLIERAFVDQ